MPSYVVPLSSSSSECRCVPVSLSMFQTIGMMPPMSKFKKSVKIYATVSDLKYSEVK